MRRSAIALGAALALAGCAQGPSRAELAARAARPVEPTIVATPVALFFAGMDADGDAVVTSDELSRGLDRTFAGGDADGDARVSVIELSYLLERWLGSRETVPNAPSFDGNGDRTITRAEFDRVFRASFADFDGNGDGRLDRSELITVTGGGFSDDGPPGSGPDGPRRPEGGRPGGDRPG